MFQKTKSWFKELPKIGKIGVIVGATMVGLTAIGVASPSSPPTQPENNATPVVTQNTEPKIEVKTESVNVPTPYRTSTINDASMLVGTSKTVTEGAEGVNTQVWEFTYTDGHETNRTLISETVSKPPVNMVVANGTKSPPTVQTNCPNGTYVNSAGNTVCSPYQPQGAPSGATARCADGTYSFSQSRRGTCSHHGGVDTWL